MHLNESLFNRLIDNELGREGKIAFAEHISSSQLQFLSLCGTIDHVEVIGVWINYRRRQRTNVSID